MKQKFNYIIIGAGISGLSAANQLLELGVTRNEILVLEASAIPGGLIRSETKNGYHIEWGPEGLRGSSEQTAWVFDKIGKEPIPVSEEAGLRYIGRGNRLVEVPTNPLKAIISSILPVWGKFRILKEPFVRPHIGDETIAAFVKRRLGKHVVPLVDAFVTGVFGGDPHQLSIKHTFPVLKEIEEEYGSLLLGGMKYGKKRKKEKQLDQKGEESTSKKPSFLLTTSEGMDEIIKELAKRVNIIYNAKVSSLKLGPETIISTPESTYHAKKLIVATGINAMNNIELTMDGNRFKTPEVPQASVMVVTLGFDADAFEEEVKGYGFLIPDSEERFLMGGLYSSRLFSFKAPDDKVMIRCFVGGIRHPDRVELPHETIVSHILKDLDDYLGVRKAPIFQDFALHKGKGISQLELGHGQVVKWREKLEQNHPYLKLIGLGWQAISCDGLIKEARDRSRDLQQIDMMEKEIKLSL